MGMRVITSKEVTPYKPVDTSASQKLITIELQDKVKVVDSKNGDYVLESVVVETSVVDTQSYIDSFKDDVGIENILKKFNMVNDPELLSQVKRISVPIAEDGREQVQDYTNLPKSEEAALKFATKAKKEFNALPVELTKGRSFSEFAENCTKDELLAFIQSQNSKNKVGDNNE